MKTMKQATKGLLLVSVIEAVMMRDVRQAAQPMLQLSSRWYSRTVSLSSSSAVETMTVNCHRELQWTADLHWNVWSGQRMVRKQLGEGRSHSQWHHNCPATQYRRFCEVNVHDWSRFEEHSRAVVRTPAILVWPRWEDLSSIESRGVDSLPSSWNPWQSTNRISLYLQRSCDGSRRRELHRKTRYPASRWHREDPKNI